MQALQLCLPFVSSLLSNPWPPLPPSSLNGQLHHSLTCHHQNDFWVLPMHAVYSMWWSTAWGLCHVLCAAYF